MKRVNTSVEGPAGPPRPTRPPSIPLCLYFSLSPLWAELCFPPFSHFFSPSLHPPPQSSETSKREHDASCCFTHTILGSGYDAPWETESLKPPVPQSSCPCALHILSAVQTPGQVFNKKENLDFKDGCCCLLLKKKDVCMDTSKLMI